MARSFIARVLTALALCAGLCASAACRDPALPDLAMSPYPWALPSGAPSPRVPRDNPMSTEKALLGRFLFYDRRLSLNETQSCGSCHQQARGFSDERTVGLGSTGESHTRNAMSLANVGFFSTFTWANPVVTSLERQALVPLFGDQPVELGLGGRESVMLERLRADARYRALFRASFPDESDPITVANVARAIACFERTLLSFDTPYDRFTRGDRAALSESAQRGLEMFNSERFECYHCHAGFNFSDATVTATGAATEPQFHNTGLYNVDGRGAYPRGNQGAFEVSSDPRDVGAFRAPSLRNIALTAPYMHDGSIATLEEVIAHYERGGRLIASGPNAGDGRANPLKSDLLRGFTLTDTERADLLAFLRSLTDETMLRDARLSDPFAAERDAGADAGSDAGADATAP